MFIRVTPDVPKINESYWYSCDENVKGFASIKVGAIVRIPLHGRRVRGWVMQTAQDASELLSSGGKSIELSKIKSIIEFVSDGPAPHMVDFAELLSQRYLSSRVTFLRVASPSRIVRNIEYTNHVVGQKYNPSLVVVDPRADRREVIAKNIAAQGSTIIIAPDSHERLVSWCKQSGYTAIHYRHDDKNKDNPFLNASQNNCVIVGGRVALFAPVTDCQSIIILDDAYEQLAEERSPRWNVSDCSKVAAEHWKIPLTFISSVPSCATHDIETTDARSKDVWPKIILENRNNADPALGVFTHSIVNTIHRTLDSGLDAALILNNTLHARLLVCRSCETIATCSECDHSISQDDADEEPFICIACKKRRPSLCLKCGGTTFKKYRRGLSSTAQDCQALFSQYRVVELSKAHSPQRNDSDLRATLYVATEALFHRKDLTQRVACCIFLDIDSMMFRPGISAFEQTLVVVNRALRMMKKTDERTPIILATRSPDNALLADIVRGDFMSNKDRELELRKQLRLAPFYATAEVESTTPAMEKFLREIPEDIVFGKKTSNDKTSVLLRAPNHEQLRDKTHAALDLLRANHRCTVSIDSYD